VWEKAFLALSRSWARQDALNPLVIGAPSAGAAVVYPARRCGSCSAECAYRGSRGRRFMLHEFESLQTYECLACGRVFSIGTLPGHIFLLFAVVVLGSAAAAVTRTATAPVWRMGIMLLLAGVAIFQAAISARLIFNRLRNLSWRSYLHNGVPL